MNKQQIEQELEEAREMLRASQENDAKVQFSYLKYKAYHGSFPADNFDLLDSHTNVNVYQNYVNQLENQLKSL